MQHKKSIFSVVGVLAGAMLLTACGASAAGVSSSATEEQLLEEQYYRGKVTNVIEGGSFEVEQVDGYNYGQTSIIFHMAEDAVVDNAAGEVAKDAFVEVKHNGMRTRSLPPQGTAQEIKVISPRWEGVVQNGVVKEVKETDEGYTVSILPFEAQDDDFQSQIILNVPREALQNITPEELQEGKKVSAVTKGIAATSLPPQMPVVLLLPYTAAQ